ncbi:hypothetical protein JNW88_13875 [Micromonospora sp. ATA32]|nr:hypothetical protein [Micromonospora sp. ATA32]
MGEPLGMAVTLRAGRREILHDPEHPSALRLPVLPARPQLLSISKKDV